MKYEEKCETLGLGNQSLSQKLQFKEKENANLLRKYQNTMAEYERERIVKQNAGVQADALTELGNEINELANRLPSMQLENQSFEHSSNGAKCMTFELTSSKKEMGLN